MKSHLNQLASFDSEMYDLIKLEEKRQFDKIRLIPSENYTSQPVLEVSSTVLCNKYSEGYPYKRFYQGQQYIDQIETIAIQRAKNLFDAEHANVQPLSGSPANLAAYMAFMKPGDKLMALELPHGGHLTHGWDVNFSGKFYQSVFYSLNPKTYLLDYDQIRDIAKKEKPKIILAGASSYPRIIDFKIFYDIAQEVSALFFADIAHISGLVVSKVHPTPLPFADVVTTTTHKTLRGPRGGLILSQSKHAKKIDSSVFPGVQGGPHNHSIAALAVALKEAETPKFKEYTQQIVKNSKALANRLLHHGFHLITGGTDNHLILIDMSRKKITGRMMANSLDAAGLVCNANTIPFDTGTPFNPSGIRIGTPAVTSRGMMESEMNQIADWIDLVSQNINQPSKLDQIQKEVKEFCSQFVPPGLENLYES